jgi:hypothetical protein
LMDLPLFPSSTSTWDSRQSSSTKKVNDSQQSSSPGASTLTNALRWDYLSAPISIKRKCQQSFLTWKTQFVSLTTLPLSQTDPLKTLWPNWMRYCNDWKKTTYKSMVTSPPFL